MAEYETHEHDVLVIGAGGAGLRASIEASANGVSVGLVCKSLLCKVGPIYSAAGVGRWANVKPVYFQPCIEPPLIALVRISPPSKLCGRPRISLFGFVRNPCAEILRKYFLPSLLNGLLQGANFKYGLCRSLGEQHLLVRP